MTRKSLVGQVFGMLQVHSYVRTDSNRHSVWLCKCECGRLTEVYDSSLKRGLTKSCGCFNGIKGITHDMAAKYIPEEHKATYVTWKSMKARCTNKTDSAYENYGGRGIKICAKWETFEGFLEDMGVKPTVDDTIERLDVNGDYTKENCEWLHKCLQAQNRRNTVIVEVLGQTMCLAEACRKYKMNRSTVSQRMRNGMTAEEALLYKSDMRYSNGRYSLT